MTFHDDPRLTRYALGEMNDDDRAALEREMSDADRAEANAIRALAGTLTGALSPAPERPLAPEPSAAPLPMRRSIAPRTRWILAAAAGVAVVGLVGSMMLPSLNRAREVAVRPLPAADDAGVARSPGEAAALLGLVGKKLGEVRDELAAKPLEKAKLGDLLSYPTNWPDLSARRDEVASAQRPQLAQATNVPAAPLPSLEARGKGSADREAQAAAGRAYFGRSAPGASEPSLVAVDADGIADRRFAPAVEAASADSYARIRENAFLDPRVAPLSTFGVDVDTASYANVRRFLNNGTLPPADAVRVEEMINYFPTSDAPPTDGRPFATYADVARCPWNASHQLVRVALKAREVAVDKRPPSNLVFLVDVSGSMNEPTKLPLVKRGLQQLVDALGENDRVAIVVYAGNSGLALPSTNAANKESIRQAIDRLEAGGSTNGGQGIELAYGVAQSQFIAGGANRVILCTDGDFNVGVTDRHQLTTMITEKAKAGVFLSVLGFGRGNLKDDTMESLADKGNGNYAYIDSDREARKVLVEQASGTLVTVAKDVKIQVEFNPAAVRSYRLIGYENRLLAKEDFNNDLKDAGEIGAGHNVVALYEIDPVVGGGGLSRLPEVEALKYQPAPATSVATNASELLTLKLRYKAPDAPLEQGTSELIERTLTTSDRAIDQASPDFQFAAAVAGFGVMLRNSSARGDVNFDWPTIARLAKSGLGADVGGHRAEFLTLVDRAASLAK